VKFGLLKEDEKDWHHWRLNFSEEHSGALFLSTKSGEILGELKLEPFDEKRRYKSKWLWHVKYMNSRMQNIMLYYRTIEWRRFGRPWKRQLNIPKPSRPNSLRMMIININFSHSAYCTENVRKRFCKILWCNTECLFV